GGGRGDDAARAQSRATPPPRPVRCAHRRDREPGRRAVRHGPRHLQFLDAAQRRGPARVFERRVVEPDRMMPAKSSTGLDENLAGALTYLLGLLTAIVFLLVEHKSDFAPLPSLTLAM